MTDKKIQDNPSHAKLIELARGVGLLEHLYQNTPQLKKQHPELQSAFDEFAESKANMDALYIPDSFNEKFSSTGWIAYESMPIDVAREAIKIYDENGLSDAENYLADSYDADFLSCASRGFHYPQAFASRLRLINLAKADYLDARYHACIPLLLSLLDGIVNDVTKSVGFFASSADLTAWDSVAAHSSGLQTLTSLLSKGRAITTEEEITIPYRNGILHGRDLAFDNKLVAAKCWAALFAVKDWADAISDGKKNPSKAKDDFSWFELIERKKKREVIMKHFHEWSPRQPSELTHFPIKNNSETIPHDTPEFVLWGFLENWRKKRYGLMAEALLHCHGEPKGKCAGSIKLDYSEKKLTSFEILSSIDVSPSTSRLNTLLGFSEKSIEVSISLLYVDSEGYDYVRSCNDGQWLILQATLSNILYPQN